MLIKRIGVVLLAVTALLGSYLLYVVWEVSPQIHGQQIHEHVISRVEIRRDYNGIPVISAKSDADLFYAQGYVHAQDRLFQMIMLKHLISGRMSEIFGEKTQAVDRYMRTFGVSKSAQSSFAQLDHRTQKALIDYANGVNQYMEENRSSLEMKLLGYQPEQWKPSDAVIMQKAIAFDLSKHWPVILRNSMTSAVLDTSSLDLFSPNQMLTEPSVWDEDLLLNDLPYDKVPKEYKDGPRIPDDFKQSVESFGKLSHRVLKGLAASDEMSEGSNVWAVSLERSTKHAALLANDPHLSYTVPSTFYPISLKSNYLSLNGASIPGAPGLIIGRNQSLSWGFTNSRLAQADIYYDTKIEGGILREEVIKVKGGEDIVLSFRDTAYGTIISDPDAPMDVALKWVGMQPVDRTLDALYLLNVSSTWSEAKYAISLFETPAQNIVLTDQEGNYGFYALGKIPIRAYSGRIAVPATNAYKWQGYIPSNELPYVENPERGYVMNANNHVVSNHYGYNLTRLGYDDFRAVKINESLGGSAMISPSANRALQLDNHDMVWQYLKPVLTDITASDPLSQEMLDALKNWSGSATLDSYESTIFAAWQSVIAKKIYANVNMNMPYWAQVSYNDEFIKLALEQNSPYCAPYGSCKELLSDTLSQTGEMLKRTYGEPVSSWQWHRAHRAAFLHPVFKGIPVLNKLSDYYVVAPGSRDSVNRSKWRKGGVKLLAKEGASLRMLVDMSTQRANLIVPMGASGHIFSTYYANLNDIWANGEYILLPPKELASQDAILELVPNQVG